MVDPHSQRAVYAIAGLGFGDEGKGTTVDWLCRRHSAALVVRYNGGAQAAHNVVLPDGRHHTFAQFGSGTFAGADTFLSRYMLVNPSAMLREADHLSALGVPDPTSRVCVDEDALVTTPFHVAANRVRELARGAGRHGSCGMGIRETVADSEDPGRTSIRVHDLFEPKALRLKLAAVQVQKAADLHGLELGDSTDAAHLAFTIASAGQDEIDTMARRMAEWLRSVTVVGADWLGRRLRAPGGPVIFEGAQGVLLDPRHGFFPHVTATDCTYRNAFDLLGAHEGPVTRLAVTRTYLTRHGAGPMPSEDPSMLGLLADDHNVTWRWQGGMRTGYLDLVAARYAARALGHLDGLVVTHADKMDVGRILTCTGYELRGAPADAGSKLTASGLTFHQHTDNSAVATEMLSAADAGRWPEHLRPLIERMSIDKFAEQIGTRVAVVSSGPTHVDKREVG